MALLHTLHDMEAQGKDVSGILSQLGLESGRAGVLLQNMAKNVDTLTNAQGQAASASENTAKTTEMVKERFETLDGAFKYLHNSISEFGKDIGEVTRSDWMAWINHGADAVNALHEAFNAIPEPIRKVGVNLAIGSGAAMLFGVAFKTLKSFALPLVEMFGNLAGVVRLAASAFTALRASALLTGITIGGVTAPLWLIVGAVAAVGVAIYAYWDKVKEVGSWIKEHLAAMLGINVSDAEKQGKAAGEAFRKGVEARHKANAHQKEQKQHEGQQSARTPANDNKNGVLNERDYELVMQLDHARKLREEVAKLQKAYAAWAAMSSGPMAPKDNFERERVGQQLKEKQNEADDPLYAQKKKLSDQADASLAVTQSEKDRLEVEKAIRDAIEAGNLAMSDAESKAKLVAAIQSAQAAKKAGEFKSEMVGMSNQLANAKAITQAEKDQLGIAQQIDTLRRSKGYSEEQLGQLKQILEVTKQIERETEQWQRLNPQAKAISDYSDQLKLLDQRRKEGSISLQEFQRESTKLHFDTLSARDPIGAIAQSQKDEIAQLSIVGDHEEAIRKAEQQVLELRKQGITVTSQMSDALKKYNVDIEQAKKAQEGGFAGWAKQNGNLQDNMNKLESSFADGLSGAISSALSGKKDAFKQFAQNFGKTMMDTGIKMMMADFIKSVQGTPGGNFLKDAAKQMGLIKDEAGKQVKSTAAEAAKTADALKNMNTGTMAVTASVVNINGTPVAGVGAGAGGGVGSTGGVGSQGPVGSGGSVTTGAANESAAGTGNVGSMPNLGGSTAAISAGTQAVQGTGTGAISSMPNLGSFGVTPSAPTAAPSNDNTAGQTLPGAFAGKSVGLLPGAQLPSGVNGMGALVAQGSQGVQSAFGGNGVGTLPGMTLPGGVNGFGSLLPLPASSPNGIPTEGKALLDAIGVGESHGDYTSMFTGHGPTRHFSDFSQHPNSPDQIVRGPNAGKWSSAAGKYQFIKGTWDDEQKRLGLKDFSPESQDRAAWDLAQRTYKEKTGGDLTGALRKGDVGSVGPALHGQWTSLPGGIEATASQQKLQERYNDAFQKQHGSNDNVDRTPTNSIPDGTKGQIDQARKAQDDLRRVEADGAKDRVSAAKDAHDQIRDADQNGWKDQVKDNKDQLRDLSTSNSATGAGSSDTTTTAGNTSSGLDGLSGMLPGLLASGGGLLSGAFNHHKDQYHSVLDAKSDTEAMAALGITAGPNGGHTITFGGPDNPNGSRAKMMAMMPLGMSLLKQLPSLFGKGGLGNLFGSAQTGAQSLVDGVMQPATDAASSAASGLGDAASGAASGLGDAASGAAGGMADGGGGIFDLLAGLFHEGGLVGAGTPASGYRSASPSLWIGAPRYHDGLNDDEFPAILQRGERVLTANDNARMSKTLAGLTEQLANQHKSNGGNNNVNNSRTVNQTVHLHAKDEDGVRKSSNQVASALSHATAQAAARWR
jgi:muramidase (phage lysozyme)